MADWFEVRAVDGFNIYIGHPEQFKRFTNEVIPLLQERGVYRRAYEGTTLRESLGLDIPQFGQKR
ncbi:putative monooxygenase MoxC [compost metagenome]